jgi:CspA family cold shock protein
LLFLEVEVDPDKPCHNVHDMARVSIPELVPELRGHIFQIRIHKRPHFRGQRFTGVTTMANGTVKWFNTTKGYGFIAPDGGTKDVFVHISAVERSGLTGLADNQKVTFDIEPGRDGRESAVNITPA